MSTKEKEQYKTYPISFGKYIGNNTEKIMDKIPEEEVEILENFDFVTFKKNSSIGYLKEYFLTNFGDKYPNCKCEISAFYLSNNNYSILEFPDSYQLKDITIEKFYLIKTGNQCDCEYKIFKKSMFSEKFEIIKQLKDYDEQIKKLENEKKALDLEKDKLKVDNSNLNKKIEEMNDKYIKKIDELNNEFTEKEKKYNNIINELKEENKKLKKTEELKNLKEPKFEDFYDIIIDINSIKNVNKEGWKVKCKKEGLEKYYKYKNKEILTIGVLGNNNKGKSFLLSKISKIKLLTGASIHTEGLSVKYPDLKDYRGRQIILLDSAGFETPVLKRINNEKGEENEKSNEKNEQNETNSQEDKLKKVYSEEKEEDIEDIKKNKEFKENARDKIMTELFLENIIIKVSEILLVVVGKLTYSEQLLINKVKVEAKKQNKGRIIIIHNLQDFRTKEQVVNYIQNTLLKCSTFTLNKRKWITTERDSFHENNSEEEKKSKELDIKFEIDNSANPKENSNDELNKKEEEQFDKVHFTEIYKYDDDKKIEIYHLIMANDESKEVEIYNKYTYKFIENIYNLVPEPKKFDVFDQVKENFKYLVDTILNDNIGEIKFNENEKIIDDKIMKLNYEKDLSLKKCYTDELSFSFFKASNFEPKYNYFKPDEKTLEIRLEVPGNVKIDVNHKIIGDETIIEIKGEKKKDSIPKELKQNLYNKREFSKFELNIPLKVEYFKINETKPKEGYPKFLNGVCVIQYELAKEGEDGSASVEGL